MRTASGSRSFPRPYCSNSSIARSHSHGNRPPTPPRIPSMLRVNAASLVESARVGADSLRSNPLRTVLATAGVIIGVGSLVAAFAITDGVEVWARALIARESSVQDVVVTARTQMRVRGRAVPVRGYPVFTVDDAERAGAEVPGVMRHALTLNGRAETEFLGSR